MGVGVEAIGGLDETLRVLDVEPISESKSV